MTVTAPLDLPLDKAVAKAHLAFLRARLEYQLVHERVCEIHEQCVIERENLSREVAEVEPVQNFGCWVFGRRQR